MGRILYARKRYLISFITDINFVIEVTAQNWKIIVSRHTEGDAKSIILA